MVNQIKWWGHAAFCVTSSTGKKVLFDPWIVDNPTCSIKLQDVGTADIILISHDHFDHVGNSVEISESTGAVVCVAPETANRLKEEMGLPPENVVLYGGGMNVGGSVDIDGITVVMTQAFHSSASAEAYGYIVKLEDGTTIYHAGDTGIFSSMGLLGEIYGIDVALLPIGSCYTMDPVQAAAATKLIKPKVVIPMHFGSFPILEPDATRFAQLVKEQSPQVEVVVLKPGEEYSTK